MLDTDYPVVEFTAHDRCDACGAQAYTLATREDMPADLLLCGHHRKKHHETLMDEGWTIIDDYEGLAQLAQNEKVTV